MISLYLAFGALDVRAPRIGLQAEPRTMKACPEIREALLVFCSTRAKGDEEIAGLVAELFGVVTNSPSFEEFELVFVLRRQFMLSEHFVPDERIQELFAALDLQVNGWVTTENMFPQR